MIINRSKEEIHQMLRYVLDEEDVLDENLLAHWTDVLFELHKIRQKFPRPTLSLLEVGKSIFKTKKMRVGADGLKIDSNHQEKWIEENSPDISVYGDITIEDCQKDLMVIGNINGETINIKGSLNADTVCNVGSLVINCDKLVVDNFRVSGSIVLNAKEVSIDDFIGDKVTVNGNINSKFFNANTIDVSGSVHAQFFNNKSDENFETDLNKN